MLPSALRRRRRRCHARASLRAMRPADPPADASAGAGPSVTARRPRLRALALALAALLAWAGAQAPPARAGVLEAEAADPQPMVRAADLARLLGVEKVVDGDTLVLRGEGVVLTVFAGSADGYLSGRATSESTLSAPVERRGQAWWLPLDAGAPFGLVRTGPDTVRDAGGRAWALRVRPPARVAAPDDPRASVLRPAPGAVAVELRSAETGPDGALRAAWLSDLALLPLLAPETRKVVDAALADAGSARALLLVVTARSAGARAEGVAIEVDRRTLVAAGARHDTLAGSAEAIAPGEPWIALVWLPVGTRLDAPLTVRWEGAAVEVVFRR